VSSVVPDQRTGAAQRYPLRGRDDAGTAPVEFVLVGVLLSVLFLGLLQLGLALHVRNTLTAAAAEGARYAANADRSPADGVARTRDVIADTLSVSLGDDVHAGHEDVAGVPTVYVEVRATLPVVGLLGPPRGLVVRGHALREGT
jgi:Flp pilus assembly protein TadG